MCLTEITLANGKLHAADIPWYVGRFKKTDSLLKAIESISRRYDLGLPLRSVHGAYVYAKDNGCDPLVIRLLEAMDKRQIHILAKEDPYLLF